MNKRIIIFILLSLTLLPIFQKPAGGSFVAEPKNKIEISSKRLDPQAEILANYLASFDSPLQYHAQDLIDAAREYDLDWKMLPAIAGVESTFGKFTPGGYNAWGWGVYGDQAIYFDSWRKGIFTIAKGLREGYLNKGLTDPYAINRAYAASPFWGGKVSFFMNDLDKFAAKYESKKNVAKAVTNPKIAVISGQLALKN